MSRRLALPIAALVATALVAVAFATAFVPWLARERRFVSSTPTTVSQIELTDVRLRSKAIVCVRGFGLDPSAEGLRLTVNKVARAGTTPPLHVEVRAPDYRSTARLRGGYPFRTAVVVPLRPPPREVNGAQVCVRNEGRTIALAGTKEPVDLAKVRVRLDGRTIVAQPSFAFVRRSPASVLDRASEILERVAAFRPFPVVPLLLGALALLVIVGVPLAVVGALALAERTDDRDRVQPLT